MKKLYSVEREYPVAVSALWDAWMDADALQSWYSPTDLKVVPGFVTSEPEENKRIVHSMNYTQDIAEFEARVISPEAHTIEIDFEDRGDSSWVRFTQIGELPEGQAEQAKAGMESYFDNLSLYLSR